MPRNTTRSHHRARQARKEMFQLYGDTCHLCGHGGAGEADHLIPLALDPAQPIDPELLRPAHGATSPCPVCVGATGQPRRCNQERGVKAPVRPVRTSRAW